MKLQLAQPDLRCMFHGAFSDDSWSIFSRARDLAVYCTRLGVISPMGDVASVCRRQLSRVCVCVRSHVSDAMSLCRCLDVTDVCLMPESYEWLVSRPCAVTHAPELVQRQRAGKACSGMDVFGHGAAHGARADWNQ